MLLWNPVVWQSICTCKQECPCRHFAQGRRQRPQHASMPPWRYATWNPMTAGCVDCAGSGGSRSTPHQAAGQSRAGGRAAGSPLGAPVRLRRASVSSAAACSARGAQRAACCTGSCTSATRHLAREVCYVLADCCNTRHSMRGGGWCKLQPRRASHKLQLGSRRRHRCRQAADGHELAGGKGCRALLLSCVVRVLSFAAGAWPQAACGVQVQRSPCWASCWPALRRSRRRSFRRQHGCGGPATAARENGRISPLSRTRRTGVYGAQGGAHD